MKFLSPLSLKNVGKPLKKFGKIVRYDTLMKASYFMIRGYIAKNIEKYSVAKK